MSKMTLDDEITLVILTAKRLGIDITSPIKTRKDLNAVKKLVKDIKSMEAEAASKAKKIAPIDRLKITK